MFSFFNTVILLGAVQGVIISCLLFFSVRNRHANRILAVLILLISLASFNLYGTYQNWFNSNLLRIVAMVIPLVIVMPLGPLMYCYFKALLDPGFSITKKQRPHFYSVIIDLVPSLTVVVFMVAVSTRLIRNNPGPWGNFIDNYNVYADIPRWASLTIYLWFSARFLKTKRDAGGDVQLQNEWQIKWLQQFARLFMVFQAIWFIFLVPYIIPAYSNRLLDTFEWYPIYVPMAVLIYWLGIKGYMVSQQQLVAARKNNPASASLSPELTKHVKQALLKAMEEDRFFLNPNCNLAGISALTGFTQKNISTVLNQQLGKSFTEFVNHYRVEAFKQKIRLPEMNQLTIAGVAMECGFNSLPSFQRIFKESTGQSPSEFRKMALQSH